LADFVGWRIIRERTSPPKPLSVVALMVEVLASICLMSVKICLFFEKAKKVRLVDYGNIFRYPISLLLLTVVGK
jgi:hypothetical protein